MILQCLIVLHCVIGVQCPVSALEIDKFENGDVDTRGGTEFESYAKYSCKAGYVLDGSDARMCMADGNWQGTAPTCEGTVRGRGVAVNS